MKRLISPLILVMLLAWTGSAFAHPENYSPNLDAAAVLKASVKYFDQPNLTTATEMDSSTLASNQTKFYNRLSAQTAAQPSVADKKAFSKELGDYYRGRKDAPTLKMMSEFAEAVSNIYDALHRAAKTDSKKFSKLLQQFHEKYHEWLSKNEKTEAAPQSTNPWFEGTVARLMKVKPTLGPTAAKKILEETARDLGDKGKDNEYGSGRLRGMRAVRFAHEQN